MYPKAKHFKSKQPLVVHVLAEWVYSEETENFCGNPVALPPGLNILIQRLGVKHSSARPMKNVRKVLDEGGPQPQS